MVDTDKTVSFTEYAEPNLKAGSYSLAAGLVAGPANATQQFAATIRFGVSGPRFRLGGGDLVSVFPEAHAAGEYRGVLPHVVLARPTLPWLRDAIAGAGNVPWLALLTLQEDEFAPAPDGTLPIAKMTAADLVPAGVHISVQGEPPLPPVCVGQMRSGTVSYPNMATLDYGEAPTDPVNVVDLDVNLFSRIAPTAGDLALLANVRTTDTYDSENSQDSHVTRAIVLGNRVGRVGGKATALLVSLENLGAFLPDYHGTPSASFGAATTVRLTVLTSWQFTVSDGDEKLEYFLTHLDADGIATVRMPGAAVNASNVGLATKDQSTGVSADDANALVANALAAGYVPLDHHLREAGHTVSWYRGPLLPFADAAPRTLTPVRGPDELLRYDPTLGMFDTSYAAAWQLGQLLALQSRSFAISLTQWKQQSARAEAIAGETAALETKLAADLTSGFALTSFLDRMRDNAASVPTTPAHQVTDFIGALRRLVGVPFGYLVPDERMLPTESLRVFTVDPDWIEALVDGAFSIGRTSDALLAKDAVLAANLRPHTIRSARAARCNDRPHLARSKAEADPSEMNVTGLLIRSQAIRGWPKIQIDAYSDTDDTHPPDVAKLHMTHLSRDVLLCLFDGPVKMIAIHESPEQIHSGVEFEANGNASTTLRAVSGAEPGHQFDVLPNGTAPVPLRSDALTVQIAAAGESIREQLNAAFGQNLLAMTANEFALEMVKGVIRVEYVIGSAS